MGLDTAVDRVRQGGGRVLSAETVSGDGRRILDLAEHDQYTYATVEKTGRVRFSEIWTLSPV